MALKRPIGPGAVHAAIDLQKLFASGEWNVPTMAAILPRVAALAAAHPDRTLFTRFTTPPSAEAARGSWRPYYRRWASVTGERLGAGMIDLVEPLAASARPAFVVDKPTYSAFEAPAWTTRLDQLAADTLVFTGVETDVCVYATLLTAVDRGYRVVLVSDAVTSSSQAAHEAVLGHLLPRLCDQVEVADTGEVLAAWAG